MDTNSVYLTSAEKDKYALFLDIINVKWDELPIRKRMSMAKKGEALIDDVNLKQVVTLLDRNYSSLYNTYVSIVGDLQAILGTEEDDVKRLFAIPSDVYHLYLVQHSDIYDFVQILLRGGDISFKTFLAEHDSSKATVLRHLKQVRDLTRAFNLRVSYEPIRLEGDEKTIRLVLSALYWLASGTNVFCRPLTMSVMNFNNPLTHEIGATILAVTYYRVMAGAVVQPDEKLATIRYPYPNLISDLLAADFTKESTGLRTCLAELTLTEGRSEAAGLFFLLRYCPVPLRSITSTKVTADWADERYIPEIHRFVTAFLERIPFDIMHELEISQHTYDIFKNALLTTTVTTYILGMDATSVVFNELVIRMLQLKPNELLHKKISDTVDYLLFEPAFSFLASGRENLIKAYYNLIQQVIQQYHPVSQVKVALVIEQDYIGYMDILTALDNIKYVAVSTTDEALRDADLIVRTSSIVLPENVNPEALYFTWRLNASSDHYARLYGIIHELWMQKGTQA
ncbi:helix-turn-helix domain-containing protein [Latilactobacillus curvatus]|uniref:helix-turn-helix domain-containing protein n=1 Tax=Latilactobacillus curvatus TaxID=28038 RepID=UPI0011BBC4A3|nr:helix-turn-helix domain-containing protein [Latilactobacillus curvatus]QEA48863.1 hypothetical protein FGL79_02885 [Latilactobacillus curvatus]WIE00941.1 helix-turn-helix domain-containing protein [Latilactobacillus curvatus]